MWIQCQHPIDIPAGYSRDIDILHIYQISVKYPVDMDIVWICGYPLDIY